MDTPAAASPEQRPDRPSGSLDGPRESALSTTDVTPAGARPPVRRVLPDAPHARIVITIASMGFFLITLDISIVNVALARIRAELGGGITGQQWMIDGYTLLFAALLLFAGNLSDRIGAKRALALGIAIFALTSAACAAAPTTGLLIAARCAQGAGAAIMLPASMALVREAFPDPAAGRERLGIWAVGGAVAGLVGQPLGGLLTTFDWRWVFIINLPVCVAMLAFLVAVATSPKRPAPFDWAGQVLAVIGLATLVYGLIDGGHAGFASPPVVVALTIAVAALISFVIVQSRVAAPDDAARPVPGARVPARAAGGLRVHGRQLRQRVRRQPVPAAAPRPLTAARRSGVPAVGLLRDRRQPASGPVTNRFGARVPVVAGLSSMVAGPGRPADHRAARRAPGDRRCASSRSAPAGPWPCRRSPASSSKAFQPGRQEPPARCSTPSVRWAAPSPSPSSAPSSPTPTTSIAGLRLSLGIAATTPSPRRAQQPPHPPTRRTCSLSGIRQAPTSNRPRARQ